MPGPFVSFETIGPQGHEVTYVEKRRYTQPKPYVHPLPYEVLRSHAAVSPHSSDTALTLVNEIRNLTGVQKAVTLATNKAYAKFKDEVSLSGDWAVNLIEYEQSVSMITRRARQLSDFVRRINRFDLIGAASVLGDALTPSLRNEFKQRINHPQSKARAAKYKKSKDSAGLILEYHYGWVPLAGDLQTAVAVVGGHDRKVRAQKGATSPFDVILTDSSYALDTNGWNRGAVVKRRANGNVKVNIGASIKVSNPNLVAMNELGFSNPLHWVWEITPYSHVVDWFVNVGQMIDSMTDFMGLELTDTYTSTRIKLSHAFSSHIWSLGNGDWFDETNSTFGDAVWFRRSLGVSAPRFASNYKVPSMRRATDAVAMLVNLLPSR